MEIIQNENYGIIHVTVQGKSESEFNAEFEKVIRGILSKVINGDCFWI